MKKKILTSVFLVSLAGSAFATKPIMHLQKLQEQDKNLKSNSAFIEPGKGYSSDMQKIAPANCFAYESKSVSAGQSDVELDSALTFNDLEKRLKIGASLSFGIGLFGGGISTTYLDQMKDTDLSFSLNYINRVYNNIQLDPTWENMGLNTQG